MKYEPLVADGFYHIFNRGNNREDIFIENRNYSYFLRLLDRHITPVADIYSYCLLKNHFHLLVRTKEEIEGQLISRAFSNLFNAYSKTINIAYERRGSLFQDRFKRIRIQDEDYLRTLVLYIHMNPVNHGMISDFSLYKYSSYLPLASGEKSFVKTEEIYELFGGREDFISCHNLRQEEIKEMEGSKFLE
ncbi:transposase [Antarcticibacterium flavum]|uniref:Transposase n=1 Tax=Antarcticibacterium flavum TaxID=2058175 RepID=A0A5B7X192_9FLAO|nr:MULTISPECIES: transposase [Antarcticibacterium]MCM4161457.1 transposase [Antarcticibacterium sp. W02-3]QCY69306.1 transposase [Antarcticibacterium flavum]